MKAGSFKFIIIQNISYVLTYLFKMLSRITRSPKKRPSRHISLCHNAPSLSELVLSSLRVYHCGFIQDNPKPKTWSFLEPGDLETPEATTNATAREHI